jgi:hypothetical protein
MQSHRINIAFIVVLSFAACNNSIKYPDGGYDYPKHVADKDTNFYFLPLKDRMPKRDSLRYTASYLLFKQFNEPNLGLRPLAHDEFRLQYSAALGGFYIITVTKNSIHIKKEIYHDEELFDDNRLTQTEQIFLNLIRYNYPYNNLRNYRKKYIDSLKIANPKVLTPDYFVYLVKKEFKYIDPQKIYTTTTIKITDKDFNHLVETINKSGYWKMSYNIKCEDYPTDGFGYGLEANTKHKYNFVTSGSCADSTDQIVKFAKACQEIVKYAHIDKEISIWSGPYILNNADSMFNIQDVPLEDIQPPHQKHKKKKLHLPNNEQKAQGSDTTKMP